MEDSGGYNPAAVATLLLVRILLIFPRVQHHVLISQSCFRILQGSVWSGRFLWYSFIAERRIFHSILHALGFPNALASWQPFENQIFQAPINEYCHAGLTMSIISACMLLPVQSHDCSVCRVVRTCANRDAHWPLKKLSWFCLDVSFVQCSGVPACCAHVMFDFVAFLCCFWTCLVNSLAAGRRGGGGSGAGAGGASATAHVGSLQLPA